jgi:hypothetical protein
MDLEKYRESPSEKLRISNLMALIPNIGGATALDVGARDGFLSKELTHFFDSVTAIDLNLPDIQHDKIQCKKGDITQLEFLDNAFDLILCAEVLEHIPTTLLRKACDELCRVTKEYLIIGVPYNQDLRFGKTTCYSCNKNNPPWGHVNKFNLPILENLFPKMKIEKVEYIGHSKSKTNFISDWLMDIAGNPWGTYSQSEECVYCGEKLIAPPNRNFIQKVFTKLATVLNKFQQLFINEQANWIHVLLKK